MSLYRNEAIEAQKARLYGGVVLGQSVSLWIITVLLATGFAGILLWLANTQYARVEQVNGIIRSTRPISKIVPPHPGIITKLEVVDGQWVRAGDILATVQMETASLGGRSPESAGLHALANQLVMTDQRVALERRRADGKHRMRPVIMKALKRQKEEISGQIALQAEVARSAESIFRKIESVVDNGFVSRFDYERRKQTYLTEQQRLRALRQQQASLAEQIAERENELDEISVESAERVAELTSTSESLRQQEAELQGQRFYLLVAPISGRITATQASVGGFADGKRPLMTVVPDGGRFQAEVFAPSRATGFIRPKQEVQVTYDAFPYQQFGGFRGTVRNVSVTILRPDEVDVAIDLKEPVYKLVIDLHDQTLMLDGRRIPLQSGMTLKASIVLERRSFLSWILAPISALRNRA